MEGRVEEVVSSVHDSAQPQPKARRGTHRPHTVKDECTNAFFIDLTPQLSRGGSVLLSSLPVQDLTF